MQMTPDQSDHRLRVTLCRAAASTKGVRASSKEASYHLTLFAQNRTGFKNLVKLASAASLEVFYSKPRIDREILERYSVGIICLSGCVSSEFSRSVTKGIDTAEHEKKLAISPDGFTKCSPIGTSSRS